MGVLKAYIVVLGLRKSLIVTKWLSRLISFTAFHDVSPLVPKAHQWPSTKSGESDFTHE
jgi:hypothetical protein